MCLFCLWSGKYQVIVHLDRAGEWIHTRRRYPPPPLHTIRIEYVFKGLCACVEVVSYSHVDFISFAGQFPSSLCRVTFSYDLRGEAALVEQVRLSDEKHFAYWFEVISNSAIVLEVLKHIWVGRQAIFRQSLCVGVFEDIHGRCVFEDTNALHVFE